MQMRCPLKSSFIFFTNSRRSLRLTFCAFYIRVEALYTLKHIAESVTSSDFFIADQRELANHPDKAWVSRLLTGIDMGVDIDYKGPRGPQDSPNLSSAYQHSNIIQSELQKELDAGRVQGPFSARPIHAIPSLFRPRSGAQEKQQVAHDPASICTPRLQYQRLHLQRRFFFTVHIT